MPPEEINLGFVESVHWRRRKWKTRRKKGRKWLNLVRKKFFTKKYFRCWNSIKSINVSSQIRMLTHFPLLNFYFSTLQISSLLSVALISAPVVFVLCCYELWFFLFKFQPVFIACCISLHGLSAFPVLPAWWRLPEYNSYPTTHSANTKPIKSTSAQQAKPPQTWHQHIFPITLFFSSWLLINNMQHMLDAYMKMPKLNWIFCKINIHW